MIRWFYIGLGAIALIEIAAPYVLHAEHGHFWFEDLPAWGSLYGLVACVAIIVVSKILGKVWLARPETYWTVPTTLAAAKDVGPHDR